MKHEPEPRIPTTPPVDSDYETEVSWGSRRFMVHMILEKPSVAPRPRWRGRLGLVTIVHDTDIFGGPMVLASAEVPAILDPGDGYTHSLNGGYHKDVSVAVAGLQRAVAQVREWLDEVSRIKTGSEARE